jgi:hypothetical protein
MLAQLWRDFERLPFPGNAYEVDGIDLARLDADVAEHVSTYVLTGRLPARSVHALRARCADLRRVSPALDAPAALYFARLERLATLVLAQLDGARPMS